MMGELLEPGRRWHAAREGGPEVADVCCSARAHSRWTGSSVVPRIGPLVLDDLVVVRLVGHQVGVSHVQDDLRYQARRLFG